MTCDRRPDHAFSAHDGRFDLFTGPHHRKKGYHPAQRKVDVIDNARRPIQHRSTDHREHLEAWLKGQRSSAPSCFNRRFSPTGAGLTIAVLRIGK